MANDERGMDMSNLTKWAEDQISGLSIPTEKKNQYLNILNAFGEQGHSGFSAGYALRFIDMFTELGYEAVKDKLDELLKQGDGSGAQALITKDILEIVDMFKEYGLGSQEARSLKRLMNWKPIVHLTGTEDEWGECIVGDRSQQNKLCSAVFRENGDNATAHYIEGRVYSDNGGHTWFTTGGRGDRKIKSAVPVTFPFWVPDKPEFIYLNGEDSEEIITDEIRIKELYDEWERQYQEATNQ